MRKIAIYNNKGGVGKSTITANLAAGLADLDFKVLLIDFDEQRDSEFLLGFDEDDFDKTIYDLIKGAKIEDCTIQARDNLDLISNSNMEEIEDKFAKLNRKEVLNRKLKRLYDVDYDFVVIDCSPSQRSKINQAILYYVNEIYIPVLTETTSVKNIGNVYEKLTELNISKDKVKMVIPNKHDKRNNLSKEKLEMLNNLYKDSHEIVAPPVLKRIAITRAGEQGKSVFEHNSKAANQFYDLVEKVVIDLG